MIDMHSHILPAIDDGARDMDIALDMLRLAEDSGTKAIMATPHVIEGSWLPSWEEILAKCQALKAAAQAANITIDIYPGAEVAIHLDILDLVTTPGPYCLNGGSYLLVELPAAEIPNYTDDFFFTLQARGITPILAHPERHPDVIRQPQILADWINKGVLAQLNAPSLTGKMGEAARKCAELLLQNEMVHIIGSDAHSNRTRRPILSEAAARVRDIAVAKHQTLFHDNPLAIVESREVLIKEINNINRHLWAKKDISWLEKLRKIF
jgi:protein-tyrosine phosphatase